MSGRNTCDVKEGHVMSGRNTCDIREEHMRHQGETVRLLISDYCYYYY